MEKVPLCEICIRQIVGEQNRDAAQKVEAGFECFLCFGLLEPAFIEQVGVEVEKVLSKMPYDATSFVLALALPGSQMLREEILKKRWPQFDGILASVPFKIRNIDAYLNKLAQASGLRPTLASDLQLTITFENDEFACADRKYIESIFPADFNNQRKRRKYENVQENEPNEMTKVQLMPYFNRINADHSKKFPLTTPTRSCTFSVSLEREPIYIAGRYCKFSRALPQSPWSAEEDVLPTPGNSVTEKVCEVLKKEFNADSYRFVSSGREDVDVRMLGDGRPFCVHLINCRKTKSLKGVSTAHVETLKRIEGVINKQSDISVNSLARLKRDVAEILSYGQEDKRKTYTAYCYSTAFLSDEMLKAPVTSNPIEIIQKTPVRVLKRRSLMDRSRTVFNLEMMRLDGNHFLARVETQAGTYIKEFVHGDFGRTRPSLADLMSVRDGDEVDILELDVEKVHLDWPPSSDVPHNFKMEEAACSAFSQDVLKDIFNFNRNKNNLLSNQFEFDLLHLINVAEKFYGKFVNEEKARRLVTEQIEKLEETLLNRDNRIRNLEAELKDARSQLASQLTENNQLKADVKDKELKFKMVQEILKTELLKLSEADRQQLAFLEDERKICRTHSRNMHENRGPMPSLDDSPPSEASYDDTNYSEDLSSSEHSRMVSYYRQGMPIAPVQKRRSRSAHMAIGGKRSRSKVIGIPEEVKNDEDEPLPRKRSNITAAQRKLINKPFVMEQEAKQRFTGTETRRTFNRSLSADELLKHEQRKVLTPTIATSSIDLRRNVGPAWTGNLSIKWIFFMIQIWITSCDVCNGSIYFAGRPSLRCTDCHQYTHESCKQRLALPCVPRTPKTPTRTRNEGMRIQDYCPSTAPMIPFPIIHCVTALERRGCLTYEGLYRIPGLKQQSIRLLNELKTSRAIPKMELFDPEVITDCIKQFLRELKDPLIPRSSRAEFVEAAIRNNIDSLNKAIRDLPQPHRDTLAYLSIHWQKVAGRQELNKMPIENIARCVAPSVVGPFAIGVDLASAQADSKRHEGVVIALLSKPTKEWEELLYSTTGRGTVTMRTTEHSRIENARDTPHLPMDRSILGPISTPERQELELGFTPRRRPGMLFDDPC
ncbi:unnamed protein product, partial [Mesorhabditis belari]|uniref:tRNA pseudouridine(55) synthase n=1 Tax=Mesorhabditis belari TaxID=2138241 RepID=A0AAF3JBA9_9BILA